MSVGSVGGSPYQSMAGVGIRMLNTALEAQKDMGQKLFPTQVAENDRSAASEAKGFFVDIYA